MQRNMHLVRSILMEIEKQDAGYTDNIIQIPEYPQNLINYHLYIMIQSKLLSGSPSKTQASPITHSFSGLQLTWQGHEFLDAARDETRWKSAMSTVQEKSGSVTVGVLIQLLSSLMKHSLGIA